MNRAPVSTMRKAAILVASLNEQEGQQLIHGLSAEDAAILRHAVANLGPIEPEERQEVMQELRFSTSHASPRSALAPANALPSPHEGVELDWSSSAKDHYGAKDEYGTWDKYSTKDKYGGRDNHGAKDNHATDTYDARQSKMGLDGPHNADRSPATHGKPFDFFGNHDTQAIAEILLHEPAQIIAVVMSQLSADQAAELLLAMPLTLQTEILERLAQLNPVDQHSLQMLESHLAEWLETHRQQEQRISQGNEKVRQILALTSNQQRQDILDKLGRRNQLLAHEFEIPTTVESVPTVESAPGSECGCKSEPGVHLAPPKSEDPIEYEMEALCMLSDTMLLDALRKVDPQITILALTGAPPHLLTRILGQLPRRQAKQFRRQLHSLQPTSMRDLLAAQQQFAEIAMQGAEESRV